jgi:hypothetical protein
MFCDGSKSGLKEEINFGLKIVRLVGVPVACVVKIWLTLAGKFEKLKKKEEE